MSAVPAVGPTTETERSITAVRWVLALLGAALALGSRLGSDGGLVSPVAVALVAGIVGATWVLSAVPAALRRSGLGPRASSTALQLLDTAAALGLTVLVDEVLPDAAWALLTIPIVIASLRLSAVGVLVVWSVTSLGYVGLLWLDVLHPGRQAVATAIVLERPGSLLAVAAGVALLTRWLQAGWVEQARLTAEAELRFQHVQAIERAGREMRGRTPDEVITTCLHHIVELGFEAATAGGPARATTAVGDGSIVPADELLDDPPAGLVSLTEWHGPPGVVYSAAMVEPRSGAVISGWTRHPPGTLQADALAELVAHTTSGVELAELLGQARFEADHDALTGLANRAHFERRLRALAGEHGELAMLFMDLDRFKQINDRFGHDAGDWALQQIGGILAEHVGAPGLPARYGGDEFVALVTNRSEEAVRQLAERLVVAVHALGERAQFGTGPIELGISVGVALASAPVDPDELRRVADATVFTAKEQGRGRVAVRWVPAAHAPAESPARPDDLPAPQPLPPPVPLTSLPVPAIARDPAPDGEPLVGSRR